MSNIKINKMGSYYFQLSEYLQIACEGMHTVRLDISEDDLLIGYITIGNGNLLNAVDNNGEGEGAFKRLILNKKIKVELKHLGDDEKKKNIELDCEELIFRIFTTKDREHSLQGLSKKSGEKLSPLEKRINEGLGMLVDKKYNEAKQLFTRIEEEFPGNSRVQSILKRLNDLI